jgi:sugar lactone lactonase YvrE
MDGDFSSARFEAPTGLVLDPAGHVLYVSDSIKVRKVDLQAHLVTTIAGSDSPGDVDGAGAAAQFSNIDGIALTSAQTLLVCDRGNQKVRRVTLDGIVDTVAGIGTYGYKDGPGSSAQFANPLRLATTPSSVFVVDVANYRIRAIDAALANVSTFAGTGSSAAQNQLYGNLTPPAQMATDGLALSSQFALPWDITVDPHGAVWIRDGGAVRKIDSAGKLSTVAGSPSESGHVDGRASDARFLGVEFGLAVSADGTAFVADNTYLRSVDPSGNVTTIAGGPKSGSSDGVSTAAQFGELIGIALDGTSHMYLLDTGNGTIREATLK